jgi:hypothetical protein
LAAHGLIEINSHKESGINSGIGVAISTFETLPFLAVDNAAE